MRDFPSLEPFRIVDSIPIDDSEIRIAQKRKSRRRARFFRDSLGHLAAAFGVVGTERENLGGSLCLVIQQVFQLSKLSGARPSPVSAIDDQYDILLTPVLG